MAVDAMAVTDYEEVKALLSAHVWGQCVRILVDLVRIARLVAAGGGKGKLCDGIETFVAYLTGGIRASGLPIRRFIRSGRLPFVVVSVRVVVPIDAVDGGDSLWDAVQ